MIKIKTKKKEINFSTSKLAVNQNLNSINIKKIINFDISVTLIKNIDNKIITLISSDIIWFSEKLTDEIKYKIELMFGIDGENILLCATHTHGSLQTDTEFKFGEYDEKFNQNILDNIINIINELSNLEYSETSLSLGFLPIKKISVNRRLFTYTFKFREPFKRSQNRPNISKKITNNLYSLTFSSKSNQVLLVIIIYSCHPVTDKENIIGKDYPGIIKKNIDKYFNINNSIFLQGFCGDVNPFFVSKQNSLKKILINYLIGPSFRKPTDDEKKKFTDILTDQSIKSIKNSTDLGELDFRLSSIESKITDVKKQVIKRKIKIKNLSINDKLSLFFINAEMLNEFDLYQKDNAISIGYSNGMVGYIAPKREYFFGGYEINGFLKRFGLKSQIDPNTEYIINSNRLLLNSYKSNRIIFKKKIKSYTYFDYKILYISNHINENQINKLLDVYIKSGDINKMNKLINQFIGSFGIIIKKNDLSIGICDSVRTYPIFYSEEENSMSFDIFDTIFAMKNITFNQKSLLEFNMSGYCLQNRTIFNGINQIRAGQIINLNKNNSFYYKFLPEKNIFNQSEENLIKKLDQISDNIFKRIVEKYKNKKILVPLSGGLDSRFVLAKLIENNCKNIEAFTYGEYNNGEYKIAKKIANKLNIRLRFIGTLANDTRKYFNKIKRKEYFSFSSSFCSTPNMQEYYVIQKIIDEKIYDTKDIVIVNGQAGDFITGGHIPINFKKNESLNKIYQEILLKHFNLWGNLSNIDNNNYIKSVIKNTFDEVEISINKNDPEFLYSYWEWSERQTKFVSNQQRIYDFFKIDWYLPLWDREFLDFWKNLDKKYLLNQYLYKKYLNTWNYKNVFNKEYNRGNVNPWIGIAKINIFIANLVGLILGNNKKILLYKYLRYFNHYSYHYGVYQPLYFLKRTNYIRNHLSLYVETFLKEFVYDWYNNEKK